MQRAVLCATPCYDLHDAEKVRQWRSRIAQRLNVPRGTGSDLAGACPCLRWPSMERGQPLITCSDTVKVLLARITLPCRDVTKLASESMDRTLPLGTRIQLQLHYWMCEACAQYRRQLLVLRQAMRHSASESRAEEGAELSPAARARLKDALRARRD